MKQVKYCTALSQPHFFVPETILVLLRKVRTVHDVLAASWTAKRTKAGIIHFLTLIPTLVENKNKTLVHQPLL